MKNYFLLRLTLLCGLFAIAPSAFAFQGGDGAPPSLTTHRSSLITPVGLQVADGAPPSAVPTAKYIFYWGKQQCDLSEANGYKGQIAISPTGFRQMMVNAPKLWNGTTLLKDFTFTLDEMAVVTADYLTQLASLDASLSPKLILGNTITIKDLSLSAGSSGSISFLLEENEEYPGRQYTNSPSQRRNILNSYFLDNAVWGRDDIYETSDRDFFTVREFWQNIRQQPAVEWKYYQAPITLRSVVTFTTKDKASYGIAEVLEDGAYPAMLEMLEPYRHMAHPGAIVTLELQTAGQYDLLYKKTMHIVADDDPRLRLRRKRDQHKLGLQWGAWSENIPELYLLQLSNPQGETMSADAPISWGTTISFAQESLNNWGKTKPEYWIDDERVSGNLSFRVTISDSLEFFVNTDRYDADSINAIFNQKGLVLKNLRFDNFQIAGYELPHIAVTLYLVNVTLARNELSNLQKVSEMPSRVKLFDPTFNVSEMLLRFELPGKSPVIISVFGPDDRNSFTLEEAYNAGENTVRVPLSVFKTKGKHVAFVNSFFGVAKVEFVVE